MSFIRRLSTAYQRHKLISGMVSSIVDMEYIRADQLPFDPRPQMGMIFSDGFYQWLRHFSKDKERLARAFAHIFDLSRFYAASHGNEIMGFVACVERKPPPIQLDTKTLRRELGIVAGSIAFFALNKYMMETPYPFDMPRNAGSIEFVATAPNHKGKGVASGLIAYIISTMPYNEYVLEVAETNTPAVRLYEKLGFKEFRRKPAPKRSGVGNFLYMKVNRV